VATSGGKENRFFRKVTGISDVKSLSYKKMPGEKGTCAYTRAARRRGKPVNAGERRELGSNEKGGVPKKKRIWERGGEKTYGRKRRAIVV